MRSPSGIQHELRHGEQRVVITEVGANIRSYTVGSRAVLDGYSDTEMCTGARGQALIPWPNRICTGMMTGEPGSGSRFQMVPRYPSGSTRPTPTCRAVSFSVGRRVCVDTPMGVVGGRA